MEKDLAITVFIMISMLCGCGESYASVSSYKIKRVISENMLELSNGKKVSFFGIKFKESKREEAKKFIKQLVLGCRVIPLSDLDSHSVVFTKNATPAYLYLWGSEEGNKMAGESKVEKRGFLNVKVGFWNVQKGIGVNLNALLIKYGYADIDMDNNYKYRSDFITLKNR